MIYFHADSSFLFLYLSVHTLSSQGILSLRWKMKIKTRECTR